MCRQQIVLHGVRVVLAYPVMPRTVTKPLGMGNRALHGIFVVASIDGFPNSSTSIGSGLGSAASP
jgi:hypothetical protein